MTYYKDGVPYAGPKMSTAWYEANGYTTEAPEVVATVTPKKYSKLAIIRALGDGWAAKRAELETAGLLDKFFAANYLAEDDEEFATVLATLTDDPKRLLGEQCQWVAE